MDFDYQFFKDMVLVGIPTLIGAYTSKFLTNSWQIRREKSKIKRDVLEEFKNSAKHVSSLIYIFQMKLFNYYTSYLGLSKDKNGNLIIEQDISSGMNNLPIQKFAGLYEKLWDDVLQMDFSGSKFLSSLRLYYRNDDLEVEYRKITNKISVHLFSINKLMKSKTEEEMSSAFLECFSNDEITRNMIRSFEIRLIDSDLHKLTM